MPSVEDWDKLSKVTDALNGLAKVVAMGALFALVVCAVVAPQLITGTLDRLRLDVKQIDLGIITVVAKETKAAGTDTLRIAEALTDAEIRLATLPTDANGRPLNTQLTSAVDYTLTRIHEARAALDVQSEALLKVGRKAGVEPNVPNHGWIFVGVFAEDDALRFLNPRIEQKDGLKYSGKKLNGLVLRYDAPVISDGDNCATTPVEKFLPPDPNAPERGFAILRASANPVEVLLTKECPMKGGLKNVYAEVAVPRDRVRFATLSTLPH